MQEKETLLNTRDSLSLDALIYAAMHSHREESVVRPSLRSQRPFLLEESSARSAIVQSA
jgi:hypothetical protein